MDAAAKYNNHMSVVRLLLKHPETDVSEGETTLNCAAGQNSQDAVAILLEQDGLDVNANDNDGVTALHTATSRKQKGCSEALALTSCFNVIVYKYIPKIIILHVLTCLVVLHKNALTSSCNLQMDGHICLF